MELVLDPNIRDLITFSAASSIELSVDSSSSLQSKYSKNSHSELKADNALLMSRHPPLHDETCRIINKELKTYLIKLKVCMTLFNYPRRQIVNRHICHTSAVLAYFKCPMQHTINSHSYPCICLEWKRVWHCRRHCSRQIYAHQLWWQQNPGDSRQ